MDEKWRAAESEGKVNKERNLENSEFTLFQSRVYNLHTSESQNIFFNSNLMKLLNGKFFEKGEALKLKPI